MMFNINMDRVINFLTAHKRVFAYLLALLVVADAAFRLIHPSRFGRFYDMFDIVLTVLLIASQVFWIRRVRQLGKALIASRRGPKVVGAAALIIYFALLGNHLLNGDDAFNGSGLTVQAALL